MDRNVQAAAYLAQLTPERLAQAGDVAFRSQLQRIPFDYSLRSLEAVDTMLRGVRASMKIDYGAFLEKQPAVNFVVLLNFYLGATIARCGNFAIKWIDHAQASQHMPELPMRLETDLGCLLGEGLFFPANVVTEMLFDPDPGRTCAGFAAQVIERLTALGHRLPDPVPRPVGESAADGRISAQWAEALHAAGFLGAWGIGELLAGASVVPVAMVPGQGQGGQRTLVDFSTFGHDSLQAAIEDGMGRLQFNPQNLPWQALYYDGYVNLPQGRRDALIVELRVYDTTPHPPAKGTLAGLFKGRLQTEPARTRLALTMALPYRPAGDAAAFCHFAPRLVECSYKGDDLALMLDTFYRGVCSAKHFEWDAHLAEG